MDIGYKFQASASADFSAIRSMNFGSRSTVDVTLNKNWRKPESKNIFCSYFMDNNCPGNILTQLETFVRSQTSEFDIDTVVY